VVRRGSGGGGTSVRRAVDADVPIVWIIFAVTADQRFIVLAEVESHTTPDAMIVSFANPTFREQGE
jgi:hypothetical protein